MGEQAGVIKDKTFVEDKEAFMFVVKPDEVTTDEVGATWEGSINRMTKVHERSMEELESSICKSIGLLLEQVTQSAKRDSAQDKDLKMQVYQMMQDQRNMFNERLEKSQQSIDTALEPEEWEKEEEERERQREEEGKKDEEYLRLEALA